jgi:hypothetical protein
LKKYWDLVFFAPIAGILALKIIFGVVQTLEYLGNLPVLPFGLAEQSSRKSS